jgi:hypothetical protein
VDTTTSGAGHPAPQGPALDPAALAAVALMAKRIGQYTAKTITGVFDEACWQFVEEWTTGDPEQREALYVAFWEAAGTEVRAALEVWLGSGRRPDAPKAGAPRP